MNEDELAAFLEEGQPDAGGADAAGPGGRAPAAGAGAATGAEGVRGLLADDATWAELPSGGADALLEAIRAEPPREVRAGAWGGPESSGRAARVPPRWSRPAQGAGHPRPAGAPAWGAPRRALVAVAAVALLVLGVVGGLVLARDDGGRPEADHEVALAGMGQQRDASAVAEVRDTPTGVGVWLQVDGLPPAEPGTYYQAWMQGDQGSVTIGTFHMREGDDERVVLWSGVELADYPTITVTLQQEGAGAESSGNAVLAGRFDG